MRGHGHGRVLVVDLEGPVKWSMVERWVLLLVGWWLFCVAEHRWSSMEEATVDNMKRCLRGRLMSF